MFSNCKYNLFFFNDTCKTANSIGKPRKLALNIESNFGLSERESSSNEESIKIYQNTLAKGVKAAVLFIPELNSKDY